MKAFAAQARFPTSSPTDEEKRLAAEAAKRSEWWIDFWTIAIHALALIAGLLGVLYLVVRFIKWAWSN